MNTGTPQVQVQKLEDYTRAIITQPKIANKQWLEMLDCFRWRLVREIFPRITLRSISQQEWVSQDDHNFPLGRFADISLVNGMARSFYYDQGVYFIDPKFSVDKKDPLFKKFWGLARKGAWIKGRVVFQNYDPRMDSIVQKVQSVNIEGVAHKELIELFEIHPALIASFLSKFVEDRINDKYRSYKELDHDFSPIALFADIAKIKA